MVMWHHVVSAMSAFVVCALIHAPLYQATRAGPAASSAFRNAHAALDRHLTQGAMHPDAYAKCNVNDWHASHGFWRLFWNAIMVVRFARVTPESVP